MIFSHKKIFEKNVHYKSDIDESENPEIISEDAAVMAMQASYQLNWFIPKWKIEREENGYSLQLGVHIENSFYAQAVRKFFFGDKVNVTIGDKYPHLCKHCNSDDRIVSSMYVTLSKKKYLGMSAMCKNCFNHEDVPADIYWRE